jgi:hypothetical protein
MVIHLNILHLDPNNIWIDSKINQVEKPFTGLKLCSLSPKLLQILEIRTGDIDGSLQQILFCPTVIAAIVKFQPYLITH